MISFQSKLYNPSLSRYTLYATYGMQPFSYISLGVMLLSLFLALQGFSPLLFFMLGLTFGYAIAFGWVFIFLHKKIVFIQVQNEYVNFKTLWDMNETSLQESWQIVSHVSKHQTVLAVHIGQSVHELELREWQQATKLEATLYEASYLGNQPLRV